MQWSQIKTLFIICFLILDIFLFDQFWEKLNQKQLEFITESTINEQLDAEDITISADLPKAGKEAYISARRHQFSDEDKERLKTELKGQSIVIVQGDLILSKFNKPIPINEDSTIDDVISIVKNNILLSEKYEFWGWNKELNTLLFFQRYQDHPIYFNEGGMLFVTLNEKHEVVQYAQTLLDEIKIQGEKQELFKPIQAIETLYNRNQLYSGDNITHMELGYHTLVPLANGVQVFAPTWKVTINDNKNFFVNAIEGQVIPSDEESFVNKTSQHLVEQLEQTTGWSGDQ